MVSGRVTLFQIVLGSCNDATDIDQKGIYVFYDVNSSQEILCFDGGQRKMDFMMPTYLASERVIF